MRKYEYKRAKIEISMHENFCVMVVVYRNVKESMPFYQGDELKAFRVLKGAIRLRTSRRNLPAFV